jgi:hypothetical protein
MSNRRTSASLCSSITVSHIPVTSVWATRPGSAPPSNLDSAKGLTFRVVPANTSKNAKVFWQPFRILNNEQPPLDTLDIRQVMIIS